MQKNWKLLDHWIASTGGCRLLPRRVDGRERKIKFSMYEPFWKLNSWSETSIHSTKKRGKGGTSGRQVGIKWGNT